MYFIISLFEYYLLECILIENMDINEIMTDDVFLYSLFYNYLPLP